MTTTTNPIYAVLTIAPNACEIFDLRVYSKQTSNKAVMVAYYEEIKARHPHHRVYLVTRERAKEIKREYYAWLKRVEAEKMARCEKNLNTLMTKQIYGESIKRVAQR